MKHTKDGTVAKEKRRKPMFISNCIGYGLTIYIFEGVISGWFIEFMLGHHFSFFSLIFFIKKRKASFTFYLKNNREKNNN